MIEYKIERKWLTISNLLMSKEITSLKKAYCVYCKTDNELNRIFLVNPEADVCYCPHCMHEQKPKDAIEEYNYFMSQKAGKAERLLFQDTKFFDAYNSFGRIIDTDPDYSRGRFGRILSLIYMSTLRKSYFVDAALLLKTEAEQYFRRLKDQLTFARFLVKADNAIKEYKKSFVKRLTVRERFYSEECVNLYFQRLYGMIYLRQAIVEELNKIYNKTQSEKVGAIIDTIQGLLSEDTRLLEQKVTTVTGASFKVEKIINDRKLTIKQVSSRQAPISHFVKYKLDEKERKGILIKNKVYPDNSHIRALLRVTLPLFIVFLLLTVGSGVYYFFAPEEYKLYVLITALACGVVFITSLIMFIVWRIQLSKRRHLID